MSAAAAARGPGVSTTNGTPLVAGTWAPIGRLGICPGTSPEPRACRAGVPAAVHRPFQPLVRRPARHSGAPLTRTWGLRSTWLALRVVSMSTVQGVTGCLTDSLRLGEMARYGTSCTAQITRRPGGFAGGPVLGQAPVWRGPRDEGPLRSAASKECHRHVLERFPFSPGACTPVPRWQRPGVPEDGAGNVISDGARPRGVG
jgi:hypothetical protein